MTTSATGFAATKRILCVDDDEETRSMMSALLGQYGYEAVMAASGSDALERAKSGGFGLFILDHWIPDSNGVELCQQLRAFDPVTPIIFYSAAAYEEDIQNGLGAGAQAYLVKPDFDNLKETIERLVDQPSFNA